MNEQECGITDQHIRALQKTMRAQNTFLFVRPTEYDSTILIKEGYATKSMDIHHKSSNWGPMAGFVPCDPAFSKKLEGNPDPLNLGKRHLKAEPVQLFLKPSLLATHKKIREDRSFVLERDPKAGMTAAESNRYIVKAFSAGVRGMAAKFESVDRARSGAALPTHRFVKAHDASGAGPKSTLFCLIQKGSSWLVYWVKWLDGEGRSGRLYPLNVFAYHGANGLNPVTGDYDMWMVAPHISHLPKHQAINAVVDDHGSSAASTYITELIPTMNTACGQGNNPVFNHGAEEQNYGFTQSLDKNLAMFTAGGTSRMVPIESMPGIMADIQNAGYLVIWNKSYGNADPRLSGKDNTDWLKFRSGLDSALETLTKLRSGIDLNRQKQIANAWIADKKHSMPKDMQSELLQAVNARQQRLNVQQSDAPEAAIFNFHQEFSKLLSRGHTSLMGLTEDDFPEGFKRTRTETLNLQRSLQKAIVEATTGGGESDRGKLDAWYRSNQRDLSKLKEYWNIS